MKYILSIDLGGTTFNAGIFNNQLKCIDIKEKDKIRNYNNKDEIIDALNKQIESLLLLNNLKINDIIGLAIASPGPIDLKKGKILDTPNLEQFRNLNIKKIFTDIYKINVCIENDANLFALGEWYNHYKKNNMVLGVTLGTGLGFGLIINGKLFSGSHGMALEYGNSPFKWGRCEKNISIKYIRKLSKEYFGKELSPRIIENMSLTGDIQAQEIYNCYGKNLGLALSHVINILDPQVIILGGGLSNALKCFKSNLYKTLKEHSPSFRINDILIFNSKNKEMSTMLGGAYMIKYYNNLY